MFTLRPHKTGRKEADRTDEAPNRFAALTKFGDAVAEVVALQPGPSETEKLRGELAKEFGPLEREDWTHDIGERPLAAFTSVTPIDTMTQEEVFAVITGLFASEIMLGPGALHGALIDGSFHRYLQRLEEVGSSAQ